MGRRTLTCAAGWRRSDAARAAAAAGRRSARQTGAGTRPVPAAPAAHRLAATPVLWLGDRGKGSGYYGLRNALQPAATWQGSTGSTSTGSATPPRPGGSPPAAPRAD